MGFVLLHAYLSLEVTSEGPGSVRARSLSSS